MVVKEALEGAVGAGGFMQRFPREAEAGLGEPSVNREQLHFRIVNVGHGQTSAVRLGFVKDLDGEHVTK